MTIPEPIFLLDAAAGLGLIGAVTLVVRRRLRILGGFVLLLGVANLGAGVYLMLPLCNSAQVLAGGKVLDCSQFIWRPVIALCGLGAFAGGVLATHALRRNLTRSRRLVAMATASLLALPASFILVYGLSVVLMLLVSLGAGRYLPADRDTARDR